MPDAPRIETGTLEDLRFDDRNANRGTARGGAALETSIQRLGLGRSILLDKDNRVIAGNKTAEKAGETGAAQRVIIVETDGTELIAVRRKDLSLDDAKARELAIADNRVGELNLDWDPQVLESLGDVVDLDPYFQDWELEQIIENADSAGGDRTVEGGSGSGDSDYIPEPPVEPTTKPGDVWLLGEHRVMCGDSASIDAVGRLMQGGKADMLLTDPPYGVSYVGKTKDALVVHNDDLSEVELAELISAVFGNAAAISREGAYWYATVPARPLHLLFAQDWKSRGFLRQIMVWVKDSMVLGHSEYHYRHEPILFGWVPGNRHKNSDRTRTTVWEYDRPKANREHPTMKPVELWEAFVEDGSRPGECVLDLFGGSGTTVIACEKSGRKARVMELSPVYCDVIVNRWQQFTGKTATLEGTGEAFP